MDVYQIFLPFWNFAFTFGRKSEENNLEYPPFRFRRTPAESTEVLGMLG